MDDTAKRDPKNASAAAIGPDVGTADPTDGRSPYEWKSRYPADACQEIRKDATYVVVLFFVSLILMVATWRGIPADLLGVVGNDRQTLQKFSFYAFAGLLGGSVFSLKYLYRVVARGYWHLDRRLWRMLNPLTSLGLAFAIGALLDASLIAVRAPASSSAVVGVGFLIGYFADAAVAKMHEVADVLFGTTIKPRKSGSD